MTKYYLDTCIWRDFYEDRVSRTGKPLGEYAAKLFYKIIQRKDTILYSDLTIKELRIAYTSQEIIEFLRLLYITKQLKKVKKSPAQVIEAKNISKTRKIPRADAFHTIMARDNKAIFLSQDKHAQKLKDITIVKRPEEID